MDKLEQIDEINKVIRETQEQEMQHKHRLAREQSKAAFQKRRTSPEYKARTHRLCDKGGTVEHFYPETKDMTAGEFYELLSMLSQDVQLSTQLFLKATEIKRKRWGDH